MAAAEFVPILPVVAILLFGIIEIGRLLHDFHVVAKGVRNATRYLSRLPMTCAAEVVAQNEGLVGVLSQAERAKYHINRFHRLPEPPAGRGEHQDVVHEAHVEQPGPLHPLARANFSFWLDSEVSTMLPARLLIA